VFNDADFDVLRTDGTYWMTLPELCIPRGNPKPVELELRFAGESNEAYQAGLKNSAFRQLIKEDVGAAKDKILAETVIVGWRNVLETDGKTPMECTVEARAELLSRLRRVKRSELVDRIENTASFPPNFRAAVVDAGDLGNA
jgi:hypothetical protein